MRPFHFLALLLAVGCGDDGSVPDASTAPDAGLMDAAADAPARADVGEDATALDAPADTHTDASPPRTRRMWVSVGGAARLAVVDLMPDGSMVPRPELDLALPGDPGPLTRDHARARLHAGIRGEGGRIATIALDSEGVPSLIGVTTGTQFPVSLEVAGDRLLSVYFGGDTLRVHDLTMDPPMDQETQLGTDDEPHQVVVGPNGAAYVPHRNGGTVRTYGLLAEVIPESSVALPDGVGPRHMRFSTDGRFAYVIHEYADEISVHTVDEAGALTRIQSISTLPEGFDGEDNTCADVHVTPDGRFVYGSNRGHDSIAMFAVEGDGTLSSLGQVPTEARPREFDVSLDGRFVVVCGQDSAHLQSYRIEDDGTLTSIARLEVGPNLLWVVIG